MSEENNVLVLKNLPSEIEEEEIEILFKKFKGYQLLQIHNSGKVNNIDIIFDISDNAVIAHQKMDGYLYNKNGYSIKFELYRLGLRSQQAPDSSKKKRLAPISSSMVEFSGESQKASPNPEHFLLKKLVSVKTNTRYCNSYFL
jgi:hypothetical protein